MNYDDLRKTKPSLFTNENAAIKIITDKEVIADWQRKRIKDLEEEGFPLDWADIGVLFDGPYFLIVRDLVEFPDSKIWSYSRLVNRADVFGGQGVVVLPKFEGNLLLLHNFRHATRSWHYEIPRGFGEPGVASEDQAHSEIKEETGGKIGELIDLGDYFNNTGIEGNRVKLYLAELSSIGDPNTAEGIESFKLVTVSQLEGMISVGEITDGFTIAAYTRAKLRGFLR
jgi:ADP-ribose pyrophosphatase